MLRKDLQGDCFFDSKKKEKQIPGKLFFFNRKFVTCDLRDYVIDNGTTNLIIAVGYEPIIDFSTQTSVNMSYIMRYTQLIKDISEDEKLKNKYKIMEIRANDTEIPPQKTTYWCKAFQLPEELIKKKHHIVRVNF